MMPTTTGAIPSRSAILSLYRNCLRSMMRIPDPEQRAVYDCYVRDGFRSKMNLHPDSRQAILAVKDATDQLERMNYYHSIRERKERERGGNLCNPPRDQHVARGETVEAGCRSTDTDGGSAKATLTPTARNIPVDQLAFVQEHQSDALDQSSQMISASDEEKLRIVQEWLATAVPHMHRQDIVEYASYFVADGFDSLEMLERELLEEDLAFMKKAHRRALVRAKGISSNIT